MNCHETESHFGADFFCQQLQERFADSSDDLSQLNILVAGCGAGHEAAAIKSITGANVEAVDVEDFIPDALKENAGVHYQVASVCELPFESQKFDAVFFYHVIEHVDAPEKSLEEIYRVTKDNGWVFIGTPNRNRLISSVGAHVQSEWQPTFLNKLKDNLRDWQDRLMGRFHNHLGAHAGYSQRELDRMTAQHFAKRDWVTADYVQQKYSNHRFKALVKIANLRGINQFTSPSVYVWCQRQSS